MFELPSQSTLISTCHIHVHVASVVGMHLQSV